MLSLEQKATQLHCLSCGEVYKPAKNCSVAEYPFCLGCNIRESQKLMKLPKVNANGVAFRSIPGKRNGMKTELVKARKRKLNPRPKRTFIVNEKGVYEKTF